MFLAVCGGTDLNVDTTKKEKHCCRAQTSHSKSSAHKESRDFKGLAPTDLSVEQQVHKCVQSVHPRSRPASQENQKAWLSWRTWGQRKSSEMQLFLPV